MDMKLERSTKTQVSQGPVLLVVMDGVGLGRKDDWDAVHQARTPTLHHLWATCPHTMLKAHGTAVGLPSDEDMGNSEVGHNALGAGRVFDQGAKLVNRAIADGAIFASRRLEERSPGARTSGGTLHLIGLLSDGNVHSHQDQLHALIEGADRGGFRARACARAARRPRRARDVRAHVRRSPRGAARARSTRRRAADYRIASGGGRMVTTMDRYEADWRIVERGWNAHVHGEGRGFASAREAIETYRAEDAERRRPVHAALRDRRRRRPGRPRSRTAMPSSSSTSAAIAPSRSAAPSRRATSSTPSIAAASRRALRRHDAVRRRPADPAAPSSSTRRPSTARWASTWREAA